MASEKIERLRAETKRLVEAEQWDKLIPVITECIKLEKEPEKQAEAYYLRGLTYHRKSNFDRAIEDFDSALGINPEYAEAYYWRGMAYNEKGDFDRAIEDFSHALGINPEYAKAYFDRGLAYGRKGDFDRAIEDFDSLLGINPEYAEAYYGRGMTYHEKGDFDRAIEDFSHALNINPEYAEAYLHRGVACGRKGDFDRAIEDFDSLLGINPESAKAYYWRGITYNNKGDFDRAIEDFSHALNINPEYAEAYLDRGLAYIQKGNFGRAIEDFDSALGINPDYATASLHRGFAYGRKGDFDRAIEDFSHALNINPEYAEAYFDRGLAYIQKGNFDRAIEDFDSALDILPEDAVAYYWRGLTYNAKGNFDRAIEDFSHALNINPEYAEAYLVRGITYHGKSNFDRAIEDFSHALNINPGYAEAYYWRGRTYNKKGEYRSAMNDLIKADRCDDTLKFNYPLVYIASQISAIDHLKGDDEGDDEIKAFDNYSNLLEIIWRIRNESIYKERNQVAHYTSLHVLKSLSENKGQFRFYNAAYMNDPEEGQAFLNMMKEEQRIDIKKDFYGDEEQPYRSPAYIGSFAEIKGDELKEDKQKDKLFLWRTYGKQDDKEAAGACLVFDSTCFSDKPDSQFGGMFQLETQGRSILATSPEKSLPCLYKIYYRGNDYKKPGNDDIETLASRLKGITKFIGKQDEETKKELRKLVRELLDSIRFLFKEKHYSEENEVRVVRLYYEQEGEVEADMESIPPRFYLPAPEDFRFNEVILGPSIRHSQEWQQWLKKQGIENVKRSKINYGKPYT